MAVDGGPQTLWRLAAIDDDERAFLRAQYFNGRGPVGRGCPSVRPGLRPGDLDSDYLRSYRGNPPVEGRCRQATVERVR
jgi:hypothetical protein